MSRNNLPPRLIYLISWLDKTNGNEGLTVHEGQTLVFFEKERAEKFANKINSNLSELYYSWPVELTGWEFSALMENEL